MKRFLKDLLLAIMIGLVLPAMLVSITLVRENIPLETQTSESTTTPSLAPLSMLLRQNDGTCVQMDMDAYLVGVLLAEMPASFSFEAKCAQAVVARTYARKAYLTGGKHADGSVCEASACCQGYCAPETYLSEGGTQDAIDDAMRAVAQTSGYVLTYDGALIEATYFSCSGGSTEDAVAVWGTDFPYLRATQSPGEEDATHFTDEAEFTATQFCALLGVSLDGDPSQWFGDVEYTSGGGVASMEIGGKVYSGTELRSMLTLRSTAFTIRVDSERICITTHGFGHRVGMSQYGADAMARAGSSYAEILTHYYSGAELTLLHAESTK